MRLLRTPRSFLALLTLLALPTFSVGATAPSAASAKEGWPALTSENKPWARWWWLGSAVDKPNLTRELEAIAANGFGGVEITPIYGAKGYEERFIQFLSPKYVEMLAHVSAEAKRLGLGVDMATGTGWPFGGPWLKPEDVELKIAFKDGQLAPVPTGFRVKRAAPGDEGPVINPYSTSALARYLAPFHSALAALPAGALRSQFHDSFEYTANWATEVPAKFKALHGYELLDHVAELRGTGDPDTVARIKADYRTTLGALHLDFVKAWTQWSHDHGWLVRNQAHGSPGNLLDLYGAVDIPETEIFGSHDFPIPGFRREAMDIDRPAHPPVIHQFASSAAHVTGRALASSESFTWLREHFREAPSQMKPEVDTLLLTGINHIFYHGDAYSPADAPWPGWLFYASTQANTRNPLWREFSSLNAYIARCQSLLQSGQPDNDLLLYWPVDDLWHNASGLMIQLTVHASWFEKTSCNQLATSLTRQGYAFDFISDAQLAATTVTDGALKTPGASFRALIVPRTSHIPVETARQLAALAQRGAKIYFADELPADVPGFGRLAARRAELKAAREALTAAHVPVLPADQIAAATGVAREPAADNGLGVTRRRTSDGFVYFLSNLSGKPVAAWIGLGRPAAQALLLDARRGTTGVAASRTRNGALEIFVQLEPGESILVQAASHASGPAWAYRQTAGAATALGGEWRVTFTSGGPELPAPRATNSLHSWADDTDAAAQKFGGTARYETEFTLPAGTKADDWRLDLGDVRETARVFVNSREVDRLWSLPFRTDIGAALHPGKNTLVLEVTSTAANRIRDLDRQGAPWKNFHEINFVNIAYRPFNAADWPLTPAGLLGPVTLMPLQVVTPQQ